MSDDASQPNAPGKRLEDVIALTVLRQIERDECALRNVIIDFDSGVSPGEARAKLEKLVKTAIATGDRSEQRVASRQDDLNHFVHARLQGIVIRKLVEL